MIKRFASPGLLRALTPRYQLQIHDHPLQFFDILDVSCGLLHLSHGAGLFLNGLFLVFHTFGETRKI
jgi:hypothetical protein